MNCQTSQFGEDLVLDCLISLLQLPPGRALEIGVDMPEGRIQCNTVHLTDRSWTVYLVDEDPLPLPSFQPLHVTPNNVNILHDSANPPDVFSLDIDGQDWWVWQAFAATPAIVIVEYNAEISEDGNRLTVPRDDAFRHDGDSCWFGASAGAMVALAHRKSYRLVTDVRHVNLFFVRADLLPAGFREPELKSLDGRRVGPHRGNLRGRKFVEV